MSEASARKIAEEIDSVRMAAVAAVERWRNMPVGAPGGWMSMAMCALDSALSAAPLAASEGSRQTADDAFNKAVDWADFPASQANVRVLGYKRDRAFFDAGAEWQASAAPLAAAPAVLTEAARDVLAERCRQIEVEGWTRLHDETEHDEGQLARAAACYATGDIHERTEPVHHDGLPSRLTQTLTLWPWDMSWWKPTSPRRNLVKAGALILAEIERLDRIDRLSTKDDAPTKE
jgi:hypothetical protein